MRSRVSIIPKLVSQMWEQMERPHRLFDQHFGLAFHPESFFNSPLVVERRIPYACARPAWVKYAQESENGYSGITDVNNQFSVSLDVRQFKPEEINVKVVDDCIVIEGKHEEKPDDHGIISRHFVRKYMIPEQCDPEKAASTLSSDGVLTITAPVKPEAMENRKERVLKIEHIRKPTLENDIEEKSQKENSKVT